MSSHLEVQIVPQLIQKDLASIIAKKKLNEINKRNMVTQKCLKEFEI